MTKALSVVDLFAGVGGFSEGSCARIVKRKA